MDTTAFCLYAEPMRRAAANAARSAGCSAADAQDVASETMISLWTIRDRLQVGTCAAYAATAARHKALNALRVKPPARLDELPPGDLPGQSSPSPEEQMIGHEEQAWLVRQIDSLPSTQQVILRLRQVEMLDNEEIARRLGISEASVATLLSRARKAMFNAIKERINK